MTTATRPDQTAGEAVGPGEPIFRLRDVGYSYAGRQTAIDGVDLEIFAGERVALLGANGSGKSTLLKLLDGILAPTSGKLTAIGRDVSAVAAGLDAFTFHREVGLVFQDPDIQLFSATVLDDVAFGPLQLGLQGDEVTERCAEALAAMEIEHLADRAPFELSGGEKKRAAIASVLSLRPDVLLLDEPTASLDPRTKWVLVDLIQRLGEGRQDARDRHARARRRAPHRGPGDRPQRAGPGCRGWPAGHDPRGRGPAGSGQPDP